MASSDYRSCDTCGEKVFYDPEGESMYDTVHCQKCEPVQPAPDPDEVAVTLTREEASRLRYWIARGAPMQELAISASVDSKLHAALTPTGEEGR